MRQHEGSVDAQNEMGMSTREKTRTMTNTLGTGTAGVRQAEAGAGSTLSCNPAQIVGEMEDRLFTGHFAVSGHYARTLTYLIAFYSQIK